MSAFIHILASYFPDTDIKEVAFNKPSNRNSVINQDFISYSIINSLHFNLKNPNNSKFKIIYDGIINNKFITSCKLF